MRKPTGVAYGEVFRPPAQNRFNLFDHPDDWLGLHDDQDVGPAGPDAAESGSEEPVHGELESYLNTALYRPKFKLVGFAVNLRTQYSSFV